MTPRKMRIPTAALDSVTSILFGSERLVGPIVARKMGEKHITLWSWLNRRSMPQDKAETLASILDVYAHRLMIASADLRRAAVEARENETAQTPE